MNIQRFVLVTAMFAMATASPAQTLVSNGAFQPTGPDEAIPWTAAYGSPRLVASGHGNPGSFVLSDTAAIRQPVSLMKGVEYEISLWARSEAGIADLELRGSTGPDCGTNCEAVIVHDVATAWASYTVRFKPARDYAYLTLGATALTYIDELSITIPPGPPAPLLNQNAPAVIPNQYIVLFRERSTFAAVEALIVALPGPPQSRILYIYESDIPGFAVWFRSDYAKAGLDKLLNWPGVLWVEPDQQITSTSITQPTPSRGLDRVDQRLLPLNGTFQFTETGQRVHAYVFDTGISPHSEFGSRLGVGYTPFTNKPTTDCNGHGTHVAGTLGGQIFGVAKGVTLHSVRVMDCNGVGDASAIIDAVDWLTTGAEFPAVANLSIAAKNKLPSLEVKIKDSIDGGITYVIAAGNRAADACGYAPADVLEAITVGAVNPMSDMRYVVSNYGACVDVFAPGTAILSAWHTANDTACPNGTAPCAIRSGTSMAAPHVAGVAALALQLDRNASPADVWNRIHLNDNVANTPDWPDVANAGAGSPDELLHWGPLNDGYDNGDPHLTTVDGTHYDFQGAGEFVLLRGGQIEIQTRQTPVATTTAGRDPYDGLMACVSINTAVAARAGSQRITYQPSLDVTADSKGMQLRVDGVLTTLDANGISLAGGGNIVKTAVAQGIEIHFADDTVLTAVPAWWRSQGRWFLNIHVNRTRATEGIMGALAPASWLPALPGGKSPGPMPDSLQQRFKDLYDTFANAWRVTKTSSLFDYAPGISTDTFTNAGWPPANAKCSLRGQRLARGGREAEKSCATLHDGQARADCLFDVNVTGATEFADAYALSEQLRLGATMIVVRSRRSGDGVTVLATVSLIAPREGVVPTGAVEFVVGDDAGQLVPLDGYGHANLTLAKPITARISARYVPAPGTEFLPSTGIR